MFTGAQEQFTETAAFFNAGQELGWLRPVIDKEFPMEAAAEAHREMSEQTRRALGKIVIKMDTYDTKAVPL